MWDGTWFGAWDGAWFGTTEVGGDVSGNGTSGMAVITPESSTATTAATKAPLVVQDPHGLLSGNPALWPEELKQAIARCCCGDEGSSSVATFANGCCTIQLPETLGGNIRNTKVHDTGLTLRHFQAGQVSSVGDIIPPWLPREGIVSREGIPINSFNNFGRFGAAWWSDLYEDFNCNNVELDGVFFVPTNFGGQIRVNYHISMNISNYFYVVAAQDAWDTINGRWVPTCNLDLVQLSYPVGVATFSPQFPVLGLPASVPIDFTCGDAIGSVNLLSVVTQRKKHSVMAQYTDAAPSNESRCGPYPMLNYKGLTCNPFSRISVFEGPNYRQVLARCPAIKAASNDTINTQGGPGWTLVNSLTDADYESFTPPEIYPCNPPFRPPINPYEHPHMEVFD